MSNNSEQNINNSSPPKIIGGYKKQGWATKLLDRISNDPIEIDENEIISAKAILMANNNTFYPSIITIDRKNRGKVNGIYLVSENQEHFELIPYEMAVEHIKVKKDELEPFQYRTLDKIENDEYQKNWPEFS
ncbi:hypothetical protein [Rossellomorea aquimaris]|uniref:hypothetical protein n=1 Tax=Rossellomorea aquimaris TaxID=189382 RepID=UPI0007D0688B|nr:hypothetical protein [Rossellomorea aquimaris]